MTVAELVGVHELPPTMSVEEAGRLLGISRSAAYRAAGCGQLPTLRLGRRLLVPTAKLLALLGIGPEEEAITEDQER